MKTHKQTLERTLERTQENAILRRIWAAKTIDELNRIVARDMRLSLPEALFARLSTVAERKQDELLQNN